MTRSEAIIIGAGQAGLAMSRCLTERGIDHVVLERGRVGERWRSERWDSLRLLTPNWMTRLPGASYRGMDPDGFMSAAEVAAFLSAYAEGSAAPVLGQTAVTGLWPEGGGYRVETSRGWWTARCIVIATGYCDVPLVPSMAEALPPAIIQATTGSYRRPEDLPQGGVLVVGAGASGVQLAEEIQRSGRPVTLSVGRHVRLPRRYRGRDIMWWLDRAGVLRQAAEDIADLERARRQPSFQLAGRADHRSIDLGSLMRLGVRLVGRAVAIEGSSVFLRRDLPETTAAAQAKLDRLLDRIDRIAPVDAPPPDRPEPLVVEPGPSRLDLEAEGIRSIVWAVGYRRSYDWLHVPVLDDAGEIIHDGGVTPARGLYVMGLPVLRHRSSTFIDGVGADASALAAHLHETLLGERPWAKQTAMTC